MVSVCLEPAGQDGLLELAADGGVVGQQDVLGHLLGDGRAALAAGGPARSVEHVLGHGPAQAADVDAAVLEEVAVLGGQEGLRPAAAGSAS